MSALQEQAAHMVRRLSDEDTILMIEVMRRLMVKDDDEQETTQTERDQAFRRLEAARAELKQVFPDGPAPEKASADTRKGGETS